MPDLRLCLCATVWSLRQYPSEEEEWSWARKFSAIEEAGFDGLMSPPLGLEYARALFGFVKANGEGDIFVVPELGNAHPAYGLSCFPDVWRDACVTGQDLRKIWNEA